MAPTTRKQTERALEVDTSEEKVEDVKEPLSSIVKKDHRRHESQWQKLYKKMVNGKRSIEIHLGSDLTKFDHKIIIDGIVHKVETELKSDLPVLIYKRAKSKIFHSRSGYDAYHYLAKKEMSRLRKSITLEELEEYTKFVTEQLNRKDPELWYLIENIYNSNLKTLLLERKRTTGVRQFYRLSEEILKEWENLAPVLAEEDLINYAKCVLREGRRPDSE